jgi:large conductance mechanosensitive channel
MLKEFKQFVLRGNVIDLAVAVVIGAAFNSVVQGLVKDFITPLVGAIYQQKQFANAAFHFRGSTFLYGDFINVLISFLIIAFVVFFLVVQPINKLIALSKRNETPPAPNTKKCPECYSEIPIKATRCAFCTTKLPAKV